MLQVFKDWYLGHIDELFVVDQRIEEQDWGPLPDAAIFPNQAQYDRHMAAMLGRRPQEKEAAAEAARHAEDAALQRDRQIHANTVAPIQPAHFLAKGTDGTDEPRKGSESLRRSRAMRSIRSPATPLHSHSPCSTQLIASGPLSCGPLLRSRIFKPITPAAMAAPLVRFLIFNSSSHVPGVLHFFFIMT